MKLGSGAAVSLTKNVYSLVASRRAVSGCVGQRGDEIEAVLHARRPPTRAGIVVPPSE